MSLIQHRHQSPLLIIPLADLSPVRQSSCGCGKYHAGRVCWLTDAAEILSDKQAVTKGYRRMSIVFALVLFGCSDDGIACKRLAAPAERYGSKAACVAGQDAALQSDAALRADYPTVVVRCLRTGSASTLRLARRN